MKSSKPPFPPASGIPDLPRMEEAIQARWEADDIFKKTVDRPAPKGTYVFFEGPPTANNVPHPGHVLTRVIKDLFPRYKSMKGYRVERKGGWDTHGLPVEIAIEKQLGLQGKQEIEAYGVEAFNKQCFENVRTYEQEWRRLSNRIGFWLDYDNAYFTFTNKYIESVWWLLSTFFDRGLLYEGHKVLPYCPLCGTTHSSHEVAQAYKDVKDPSVYIRFRVKAGQTLTGADGQTFVTDDNTFVLAWTTTPWTLPSNVGLAVHPEATYKLVRSTANPDHHYLLADSDGLAVLETGKGDDGKPVEHDLQGAEAVLSLKGDGLQDLRYEPLYDWAVEGAEGDGWRVITADYVTLDDGTGIVHIAPAFGEDDYKTAQAHGLPFICAVEPNGRFRAEMSLVAGQWFKDADADITVDLKKRGLLLRSQKKLHPYPFCWRHDTPLYYSATSSWFIRTTAVKDQLIAGNQTIGWRPDHIKDGRFGKWLEGLVDWALSRKRYWGTPLPIWRCDGCGKTEAISGYERLFERAGMALPEDLYDQEQFNPHRPFIDGVSFGCDACEGTMNRVEEVIDCWFDSGAMPFAQHHYPFENKELIDGPEGTTQYPADFISEAIDQTRGWFYTLHAISTLLKGKPAYKNCLVLGHVLDGDGLKMSKSRGNVLDCWEVVDAYGADAFRWHFYRSMGAGQPARFSVELVRESVKSFLIPLWNAVSFFTIYANIDGWRPGSAAMIAPNQRAPLDRWILSRLTTLTREVETDLDDLRMQDAAKRLEAFLDQLNNWYIRRSRRRFWTGAEGDDKQSAYQTLHQVLTTLSRVMAPFIPFTAEELYQRLERPYYDNAAQSVHLCRWPEADDSLVDADLEAAMADVLRATSLALAARNASGIKVRQPLARVWLVTLDPAFKARVAPYEGLITDELNVGEIQWATDRGAYVSYRVTPNFRVLGRRFGKLVPKVKAAVMAADPAALVAGLDGQGFVELEIEGNAERFSPEELDVAIQQKEGTVTANDETVLAALDTTITPELRRLGLVREVINKVQGLRKDADLAYTDRITCTYQAEGELAEAIDEASAHIKAETLAQTLTAGAPNAADAEASFTGDIDGNAFSVCIRSVQ